MLPPAAPEQPAPTVANVPNVQKAEMEPSSDLFNMAGTRASCG
jgi:hypothetical protein